MKYLLSLVYLVAGIILPLIYINIRGAGQITANEGLLLAVLFVFCTTAGLIFLLSRPTQVETGQDARRQAVKTVPYKRQIRFDLSGRAGERPQPAPADTSASRLAATDKKPAPSPKLAPSPQPSHPGGERKGRDRVGHPFDKPNLNELMEEVKNLIKLESWQLSLEKANELIHYYPDSPEADKVRHNLSFLIQKTRGIT